MFRSCYILFTIILFLPAQIYAQVIEIDVSGEPVVYDGPTFTNDEGASAVTEHYDVVAKSSTSSNHVEHVARAERDYALPKGLIDAVIHQESRCRMNAVSGKGALGLMQLMPGTAAQMGVNPYIADQNIRGGARYLRQQIDRFGSIPLALAAYNAGPGAVTKYGGIPPYRETRDYVTKILGRWRPPAPTNTPLASPVALTVETETQINPFLIEVTDP